MLNEIDTQIQAYMVTLLVANALIALATGCAGGARLPNAGMWGVFAGVFTSSCREGWSCRLCGLAMFVHSGSPQCCAWRLRWWGLALISAWDS